MLVTFFTRQFTGRLRVEARSITMRTEAVIAVRQAGKPIIRFQHGRVNGQALGKTTLNLPPAMGLRMLRFINDYFVSRVDEFDCRSFLFSTMGWHDALPPNRPLIEMDGALCNPRESIANTPYFIVAENAPTPHFMLGTDRPGYSLGVSGRNSPLIFARNTDLLRLFGRQQMAEIKTITIKPK